MKTDYRVRAQKFVKQFMDYCGTTFDCHDCSCVSDLVDSFNYDKHRAVQLNWGIVRMALITSDYVIKWDYDEECVCDFGGCYSEMEFYQTAVECGYEKYFARVDEFEYNGFTFYVMPRVNMNKPFFSDWRSYVKDFNARWWIDENVDDLHGANWGIRDGELCIIDYAMNVDKDEYI